MDFPQKTNHSLSFWKAIITKSCVHKKPSPHISEPLFIMEPHSIPQDIPEPRVRWEWEKFQWWGIERIKLNSEFHRESVGWSNNNNKKMYFDAVNNTFCKHFWDVPNQSQKVWDWSQENRKVGSKPKILAEFGNYQCEDYTPKI